MSRRVVVLSVCAVFSMLAMSARAQVVYEPVQYQYFSGGRAYYYGGADPYVHWKANQLSREEWYGRTQGYAFHSGTIDTHREVSTEPTRVYTDMIPTWNARVFGYTENDARNAAYANAATYFRKADLRRMARVEADGTWTVPSQPGASAAGRGTIEIKPVRAVTPAVRPVGEPKPLLVIPKRLLDRKLWEEPRMTADARG